jgi:cytochrome c553
MPVKNLSGLNFQAGLLCVLLLLLSQALSAMEPVRATLELQPDIDNGRRLFGICARCHLPEAWGTADGGYPQLAGQHVNVLMKQVLDIRSGWRDNPTMQPFVQQRTIGDYQALADVVAYISTLPMTPAPGRGPWQPASDEYEAGQKIYSERCAACHGADGRGDNARGYPRLQGQHYAYMLRQAGLVREGLRRVDAGMTAILKELSASDIERALNYVSYLPVPAADLAPSADWRNPDFN